MRIPMRRLAAAVALLLVAGLPVVPAGAGHGPGAAHATIKYWNVGQSEIGGYDPHETTEDLDGVTGHVSTPDAPLTLVTSMENTLFGYCGPLYWNPKTNEFKTYPVTGGFQGAVDVNRDAPAITRGPNTFGPGDAWMTVNGNSSYALYVNFRNSDRFRRYPISWSLLGVRVDQATGKIYSAGFQEGKIFELDPATDTVRSWSIGSLPYWLDIDGRGNVYTAAAAGGGNPDQIVRLTPSTGAVKRWNIPGGGLQGYISFGMPNGVRIDPEDNVWFSQTGIDTVSRLDVAANQIVQYTEPGLVDPNGVAASGMGSTLQAFFTERGANEIGVINAGGTAGAPPITVTPAESTLTPATITVQATDFTVSPTRTNIPPQAFASDGDAPDIIRFPAPAGVSGPAGISRVAEPRTIYGSFEGSDHVFRLESDAIVATPPGTAAEAYSVRASHTGVPVDTGKVNRAFVGTLPAADSKTVLSQSVPSLVSVGIGRSDARTAPGDSPTTAAADASHSVADVDLVSSAVTAAAVRAVAHAEFDSRSGAGRVSSDGSGFTNLKVGGTAVSDAVAPNTTFTVPGVGTVVLREEISTSTPRGVSLQVNMIHFTSADGAIDIVVSSAFAGAGRTVTPGDAGMVLPTAPEPPKPSVPHASCVTGDPLLQEGFEGAATGWAVEGNAGWGYGAPTYGPGTAAEGSKSAGTVPGGPYPHFAVGQLVSPAIDLSGFDPSNAPGNVCAGKRALLKFRSWFRTNYYYYDCGFIEATTDGSTWTAVEPVEGYNYPWDNYCGGQIYPYPKRSFSGPDIASWRPYTVDLTPFAGESVRLRFRFGSYWNFFNDPGWYVDAVKATIE